MLRMIVGAAVAATLVTFSGAASAQQSDADFFKGKTLRMIIGYGAGGGYDLYGRFAAEFLGAHLPGNPTIVPQNMPGGGSIVAAKYLYSVAPKDGTAMGCIVQSLGLDAATGNVTGIDATRFTHIGRLTSNIDLGIGRPGGKISSFEDARAREFTVGATGGASPAVLLPTALNVYGGAKFKIIRGYQGIADTLLALERGEVDVAGSGGLVGLLVSHPTWVMERKAPLIYQASLKRHPLIPHVPTLEELALSDEGRQVMRAISSTAEIGRSIVLPPDVPAARVAVLREAFQAMLKDKNVIAVAAKRNLMLDPGRGEDMDALVRETMALPKDIVEKVGRLLKM
ncbi:MAG: tripartite tricarboxylate transporter substrate-binding protein [Beijerinckiaceae bacterium]|nr:tripartite tricarboxylate transporter substrate-binding protein [Beijerinckiaceae bacterium]